MSRSFCLVVGWVEEYEEEEGERKTEVESGWVREQKGEKKATVLSFY